MQLDLPFLQAADPDGGAPRFAREPRPDRPADPVVFVRVRAAKRYILRVRPDGTLRVTVPRGGSRREAEEFVAQNRRWIERERHRVREQCAPMEWRHGSELLLRGERVRIEIRAEAGAMVAIYGERRVAVAESEGPRAAIERDLRTLAHAELEPRLRVLAGQHGLDIASVSIRNQRSRWGSCARDGRVALNFRLVQMPPDVRDYVLLHELMHLRQQNHSRRFWRLVESVCPSFRDAERWLRTTGRTLF